MARSLADDYLPRSVRVVQYEFILSIYKWGPVVRTYVARVSVSGSRGDFFFVGLSLLQQTGH